VLFKTTSPKFAAVTFSVAMVSPFTLRLLTNSNAHSENVLHQAQLGSPNPLQ